MADPGFLRRGTPTPEFMVKTHYFVRFLPKTTWKWKKFSGGSKGDRGMLAPSGVQILSISCSFWENFAKSYVGAPRELAPPPRGNPGFATEIWPRGFVPNSPPLTSANEYDMLLSDIDNGHFPSVISVNFEFNRSIVSVITNLPDCGLKIF